MKYSYMEDQNCSVNLISSILKEFGADYVHKTLPLCDELFSKRRYNNIVLMILDGMGQCIIEKNLKEDGFLRTHQMEIYQSVYPPTTVAVMNSLQSGLYPSEHGWLGWSCYLKEVDQNVDMFSSKVSETNEPAANYHVPWNVLGYETVAEKLEKAGGKVFYSHQCMEPYPENFEALCCRVESLCQEKERKYICCYWGDPDSTMHRMGCYTKESVEVLKQMEDQVENMCNHLKDTLVLITADHGHIDSNNVSITDYPNIMKCLIRMPSIEPRTLNLFIKSGMEQQFEQEFKKEFGGKFELYTKKEVLERKLFGPGREHTKLTELVGDYVAVAVDNLSIFSDKKSAKEFVGVHAGCTPDEMMIPLIAVICE